MYKLMTVGDKVRVPPKRFGGDLNKVVISELENTLSGKIDRSIGFVLCITEVKEISDGRIIMGDGAIYYDVVFEVLVFQPQLHEVVKGSVTEITEFGAFVNFGPIDGLIHVSQVTEDFINYDQKNAMLIGKESGKVLKQGDNLIARVVTVSLGDRLSDSKIGLTMRQPYLGKVEWLEAEKKEKKAEKKPEKKTKEKIEKKKNRKVREKNEGL